MKSRKIRTGALSAGILPKKINRGGSQSECFFSKTQSQGSKSDFTEETFHLSETASSSFAAFALKDHMAGSDGK